MKSNITNNLSRSYVKLENKLPLEKFIPTSFLIFLLSVFILTLFTFTNTVRYKGDIDLISLTNEIIKKLDAVYTHNMQLNSINRGYSIVKDNNYYSRYDSVSKVLKAELSELVILEKIDPEYISMLKSLDSLSSVNIQVAYIAFTSLEGRQWLSHVLAKWWAVSLLRWSITRQKN